MIAAIALYVQSCVARVYQGKIDCGSTQHMMTNSSSINNTVLHIRKGALFVHNFNVHFSPPPDGYNNRLTVHVCTILCYYYNILCVCW